MSSCPTCSCLSCPDHSRVLNDLSTRTYPSSLSDAQWELIAPLLPAPASSSGRGGRPEKWPRRLVLDAIFYVVRGGIPWRALPAGFPPVGTVYGFFARLNRTGVWRQVHDALRDQERAGRGRDPVPTAAVIDSQSVQGSHTVTRTSRGYDAGKRTNGRKRHIAVDTNGLVLTVLVTAASVQDRDGAIRLLTDLKDRFSRVTRVWADGGYAGRLVTLAKQVLNLGVEIVRRSQDTKGFQVLHRRWVVERTFAWLTANRRLVRDYETRPDHHEAMIYIAMIHLVSQRLATH